MNSKRTCIVCRKKSEKSDFLKIVFNKNLEISIADRYLEGRGAYICKTSECLKKCVKTKALNRAFKTPISQEFYESLLEKYGSE